jgi:hypothetical protein
MNTNKILYTLRDAQAEILDLRRRNEILSAKVEMIDLFACVLHTKPAEHVRGASPDVAYALGQLAQDIETEEADKPRHVERA